MNHSELGVVGIGTSPLMLMRATRLAQAGRRVTLLDRATTAGGAWAAVPLLDLDAVEFGAHLFENRPALTRALERNIGVQLAQDPCFSLVGGKRASMGATRVIFHAGIAAKALVRGEAGKARRGLRSAWRTAFDVGRPYVYPVNGALGLIETLLSRFKGYGGTVRFGRAVHAIRIEGPHAVCVTDEGELLTEQVVVTSRAWAPITVDGRPQPLEIEEGMCWNAVLRLPDAKSSFSYVEILGHPLLKRVRDVSAFARPRLNDDERLLAVQYRGPPSRDGSDLGEQLVAQLAKLGLLQGGLSSPRIARADVALSTLADTTLVDLRRRGRGVIETLSSVDFAEGFVSSATRLTLAA